MSNVLIHLNNSRSRKERQAILVSIAFVAARLVGLWPFLLAATPLSVLFWAAESSAVLLTVWALLVGRVDTSWRGLCLPLCYLGPLFLRPGPASVAGTVLMGLLFLSQQVVRWYLGKRCTVGVPVWVSLRSRGPYAYLRHPLSFIEAAMVVTVVCSNPVAGNLVAGVVAVGLFVVAVLVEETYLLQQAEYREYAVNVRWRWIPGVF